MWNTMINMDEGVEIQVNGRDQILNKINELLQTRKDASLQIQEAAEHKTDKIRKENLYGCQSENTKQTMKGYSEL